MNSRNITAALLIVLVMVALVCSRPIDFMQKLFTLEENQLSGSTPSDASGSPASVSQLSNQYDNGFWHRSDFIWGNGAIAKQLGMRGYYSDLGVLVYNGDYIVSAGNKTSTDYEIEQLKRLAEVAKAKGTGVLYVNAPAKYLDDSIISESFGIESYSNRKADDLMRRLRGETDIACVDLREDIVMEGKDIYSMFYRTDHHWTVPVGLWAARRTARALNESLGFEIDLSRYDDDRFTSTHYHDAWVGEQGQKISEGYIGRDDFTCIEPKAEQHYSVTDLVANTTKEGGFELLLDKSVFDGSDPSASWHYSYMPGSLDFSKVVNHDVDKLKILYLCDSYSYVVVPFLCQGIREVTTIIPRSYSGDILNLIESIDYDAVVILYSQVMIGAHNDPNSSNYHMFTFDRSSGT